MENANRFSKSQKMITVLCMIAYTVLYFMRLNVSLALTGMEESLLTTPEQLGMMTTAFFWCYAFGQLFFGFWGDRLPTRFMVFTGLLGSGILNMAISFAPTIGMVSVFWALNGIFQSMLWSPMMKTVSQYFEEKKKVLAIFALSITQVLGYILAWCVSYFINTYLGWRFVFRIPSLLGIAFSVIWLILFRFDLPTQTAKLKKKGSSLIRQPILITFLGVIALFSILFGLVKSSIDTWLPTMIEDLGGFSESGTVITLVLIPLLNFAGILLVKSLVKRLNGDIYKCILAVWGASLGISIAALIVFGMSPVIFVIINSLMFGVVYGMTPLFTSFIPLDFEKWDCVSTVTGFVDFAIYFGAGITGTISGMILGSGGAKNWNGLSFYWFLILVVGMLLAIFVFLWHRKLQRRIRMEESEWD